MEKVFSLCKDSRTMTKRCLRLSFRNVDTILTSVIVPILMIVLFTYIFGGALNVGDDISYINYLVPGILMQCIGQGSSNTAISMSNDFKNGIISRFATMPFRKSSVLIGHVAAALTRNVISTILVIFAALLIGFRPTADLMGWLLITVVLISCIIAISWISVYLGLKAKSPEGAGAFAVLAAVLPFISSGFVPVDGMPKVLKFFAENQPMTPIIDTLRSLSLGQPLEMETLALALGWCVLLTVLFYILSTRLFKHKTMR